MARAGLVVLIGGSAAACVGGGGDASGGPTAEEYEAVANSVALLTAGDVRAMTDELAWLGDARASEFVGDFELTCVLEGSGSLPRADCPEATMATFVAMRLEDGPGFSADSVQALDWVLWDLQEDVIRLDGTARFYGLDDGESDVTDPAAPLILAVQRAMYEGVRLSRHVEHPIAGAVHATVVAGRSLAKGPFLTIDASTTFSDDGTAELVLDGDHRYHLLLDGDHAWAE